VKKIYVVAILLLVAMLIVTAAVPKPGPKSILHLRNKMLNQTASLSLNGLTNFYTYYLTAKAYAINVKYPTTWFLYNANAGIKGNDTTYEVRSDFYEAVVYACGQPGLKGVINLTRTVRLVFPLCDKAKSVPSARGNGGVNMGEPAVEKISTARFFPGYFDPGHLCYGAVDDGGNSIGGVFSCVTEDWVSGYDRYVGDGYSDGTTDGDFWLRINGAQSRWMLDFVNQANGGVDVWH
jgi:hypothetical protein